MRDRVLTSVRLRRVTAHRLCDAAMRCATDGVFTLEAFTKNAFGTDSGKTLSGAGRTLADMERAGLVRKLGKNAFGKLLFRLTSTGLAMGSADPLEVAEPAASANPSKRSGAAESPPPPSRTVTAPPPPASSPPVTWGDSNGVTWTATADGLFWWNAYTCAWVPLFVR